MLVKTKESEFYLGALLITFINGEKKKKESVLHIAIFSFFPSPDATPN